MAEKIAKKEDIKSDTLESPKPGTSKEADWIDGAWGWNDSLEGSYSPMSCDTEHQTVHMSSCPSDSSVKINLFELDDDDDVLSQGSNHSAPITDDKVLKSDNAHVLDFDQIQKETDDVLDVVQQVLMNAKQVKFGDVPPMKPNFVPTGIPVNPDELEALSDGEASITSLEVNIEELTETALQKALREFQEDEEFYAFMFRPREWKKRRRLTVLNFYEPVNTNSTQTVIMWRPKSIYLLYNTPVQISALCPHPFDKQAMLTYSLAVYIKPEVLKGFSFYVCDGSPLSLTTETKPVYRNVFELVSAQTHMEGLPIILKSVVYIKLFDKDEHKFFYLTCNNINEEDTGKLYLTDTLDEFCEFEILPLNSEDNWKYAKITQEMSIKHVVSGTYVVAKISQTVFNIFGTEKEVESGNSLNNKDKNWLFSHGLSSDELLKSEARNNGEGVQSSESDESFKRQRTFSETDDYIFKKPKSLKKKSQNYF